MKAEDFRALVEQMRQAQRSYFKDKSPQWLSLSKELERRVDAAIRDMKSGQKELF